MTDLKHPLGNHMAKIERMKLQPFRPGSVYTVTILHDDGCAIFSGGLCNCDPEVSGSTPINPKRMTYGDE